MAKLREHSVAISFVALAIATVVALSISTINNNQLHDFVHDHAVKDRVVFLRIQKARRERIIQICDAINLITFREKQIIGETTRLIIKRSNTAQEVRDAHTWQRKILKLYFPRPIIC